MWAVLTDPADWVCHIGTFTPCTVVMLRLSNRRLKSNFFFENRIESKSIFWVAFFRFWLTAILAKTTHCSEYKAWQLSRGKECWIRRLNYTNCMPQRPWWSRGSVATARGRFTVSCIYPTHPCINIIDPISPLPCLGVTRAGDRVHLISTSPSIIGLCVVSERLSANLLRHISSE